jgi:hypothetical protein
MDRTEMTLMLQRLVTAMYAGGPVPPAEGGPLFRAVCDERRREGDLFWTESRLHDLARKLGYWPWTVGQIGAAMRNDHDEVEAQALPSWF